MSNLTFFVISFVAFFLIVIFIPDSYGLDNDFISTWGSFGIDKPGPFHILNFWP